MVKINQLPKVGLIGLIKLYQYVLSPQFGSRCRFYPSCSEYAVEAIQRYGIIRGLCKMCRRILKCHPWHPGGYDPLVKDKK